MAAWPEVTNVRKENRYELVLSGGDVSKRLEKNGLPDELFTCKSLNFLRVSESCLNEVPGKIKLLDNLTSLVLHSNKLTELCPEIGQLTKLKCLNVSNNQIERIPDSVGKLESLTTLNVSSNKIEKMPDLSNNTWLSIVDFSHNSLTDMSPLCHTQLTRLSDVNLKGNKINSIPCDIKVLTALKALDLTDNEVSQVVGEISEITKLKDIKLQGNPLEDKRLGKLVIEGKSKQILDYIRDHCVRKGDGDTSAKGKKGKTKKRGKQNSEGENPEVAAACKYKIQVLKSENCCVINQTKFAKEVRPYILACVIKNVSWDVETVKKFIQIQNKMHDGVCDKRNFATLGTHDLALCKGRTFTYTALSPEGLKILPLSRPREFTGKELFTQLQTEAEALRKEKKRNTYLGIHKFLYLLEDKPLYPCLLNSENTVISFPPLTNSELTKISAETKEVLIEVTSSKAQSNCKKVLDSLLKQMVQSGIGTAKDDDDCYTLTVEPVKVEEVDGHLLGQYPTRIDLQFEDDTVHVMWPN